MYKLGKWLHELGARHERELLKADLYYFLGWQPERRLDTDSGMQESEEHYNNRLNAWFEARKLVEEFFVEQENKNRK